jgi:hypothetical protein
VFLLKEDQEDQYLHTWVDKDSKILDLASMIWKEASQLLQETLIVLKTVPGSRFVKDIMIYLKEIQGLVHINLKTLNRLKI